MSLIPKTAVFQVRIDPDLLARFHEHCHKRHYVTADVVRRLMMARMDAWGREEIQLEKERLGMVVRASALQNRAPLAIPTAKSDVRLPAVSAALAKANAKRERKKSR